MKTEDTKKSELSIHDVIFDYENVKNHIDKNTKVELVKSLEKIDILKLFDNQIDNAVNFLKTVDGVELEKYLEFMIDRYDVRELKIKKFLQNFYKTLLSMKSQYEKNNKK